MQLEYKIGEQDLLSFQLFTASQSPRIKKRMKRGWVLLTLGAAFFAFYFYLRDNIPMSVYFVIVTIIFALFYPKYYKWFYKRHYKTYIRENYANRVGINEYVEITDQAIFTKNRGGEVKINTSEIERIDETENYFFVKIKTGESLIIPRHKIPAPDEVRTKFESLGFIISKVK